MDGALNPYEVTLEYCWQLIQEYSILQSAQLYVLLKKYGSLDKNKRHRLVRGLCRQWHIHEVSHNGIKYIANKPDIRPSGRYEKQIACFWVLLDYFSQAEKHYATGSFTRISMEITGQDYSFVYMDKGDERLCMANMDKSGSTKFIVVLEDISQISMIHSDKIRIFATVDEKGKVSYYKGKEVSEV